jgi:hypothetical protein
MSNTRRELLKAGWAMPAAALGMTAIPSASVSYTGDDPERMWPLATTERFWAPVAEVLGRSGRLLDDGRVYRVGFPRRDLAVACRGVRIRPALSLGSYTAFARYRDDQVLLMGDLVLTETELAAVTDALQAAGIAQTGIHKHLPAHEPPLWWAHIHAVGDPRAIASGVRAALDATGTPPAVPSDTTPAGLDSAALDAVLGRAGAWDGGVLRYTIARPETVTDHHRVLTPAMGITTVIGLQPTGSDRAAINGDFAMCADEVQGVIRALRAGGINPVELHNHGMHDKPRLFYLHFWAEADCLNLARALRGAIDVTGTHRTV